MCLYVCIRPFYENVRCITKTDVQSCVCLCVPAPSRGSSQAEKELQEVKDQLDITEEKIVELTEQLQNANANVEQYRAVVLTLEETLKKEKEVFLKYSTGQKF